MSKKKQSFHKKSHSHDFLVGRLFVTRRGSGFVSAHEQEYFISAKNCNGAMDGDTIAFRPLGKNHLGKTARVMRIIERAHFDIIGRFERFGALSLVIPRNKRITYDAFVDAEHSVAAEDGDWVRATISCYPTSHQSLQVVITEVIAHAGEDEALPEEVILANNDIKTGFSPESLKEADNLALPSEKELVDDEYRRDLRMRSIFTIDPTDARDFDDALSIEFLDEERIRLGVHIADVSHYVQTESALDRDARLKTTSTYLPTRVIAMLPETLSQELCSLNPHEDRLTMSVDMVFDEQGTLLSHDIYSSVIRSSQRYNYDEVLKMLEGSLPFRSEEQSRALKALDKLAKRLSALREERGGLEFNTRETKVLCDAEGKPVDIVVRVKTDATQMVEEAMIRANEVVATYLHKEHVPTVYRVHEPPSADALDGVAESLKEFGYRLPAHSEVTSHAFQSIIAAATGQPEEYLVSTLLLRTLKQAYYSPEPLGHFGLSSEFYTHFTSPIRRYPDVLVHRILKMVLQGEKDSPQLEELRQELEALTQHCSFGERNAQNAERESTRYKLCEYLKDKVGEEFSGVISNVSHFGLFVTLDNSAEGLVHKVNMPAQEVWAFDSQKHMFTNEKRSKRYRLGQPIRVVLISVNLEEGLLDFKIVE